MAKSKATAGKGTIAGHKSFAEVKLLRMRSENESLREDVDVLKADVETLKGNVKALLKSKEEPSDIDTVTPVESVDHPSDESNCANSSVVTEGTAAKDPNKKTKEKGNKLPSYLEAVGGSSTKIAAGTWSRKNGISLLSIALLVSIALGQGIIGRSSPLLWEQEGRQSPTKTARDATSATKAKGTFSSLRKRNGRKTSARHESLQNVLRPSKVMSFEEGAPPPKVPLLDRAEGKVSRTLQANTLPTKIPTSQSPVQSFSKVAERNALVKIYESANGDGWRNNSKWLDPYVSHCEWHGVTCDPTNTAVLELNLRNNGLSGELSREIAVLEPLKRLDLSNNEMKGMIPPEIGYLINLEYIRLCYNGFNGNVPFFGNMHQLELLYLHGNMLTGAITNITPPMVVSRADLSSFVADCGEPSTLVVICEKCTLCCNSGGYCRDNADDNDLRYQAIKFFTVFLSLCVICVFAALAIHKWKWHQSLSRKTNQPSMAERDNGNAYALETIGQDSVYQFFIGNSLWGWAFALATVGVQIYVLLPFLKREDSPYEYQCATDEDACENMNDESWRGRSVFGIIMLVHLMKDLINGAKLIWLSCRSRQLGLTRLRYLFGGMSLIGVSAFTIFVSVRFNTTTATSDSDWIVNSVIILFVTEVDERIYDTLGAINKRWVEKASIFAYCETGGDENQNQNDNENQNQVEKDDEPPQAYPQLGTSRLHEDEALSPTQEATSRDEVQRQNELLREQNAKLKSILEPNSYGEFINVLAISLSNREKKIKTCGSIAGDIDGGLVCWGRR